MDRDDYIININNQLRIIQGKLDILLERTLKLENEQNDMGGGKNGRK